MKDEALNRAQSAISYTILALSNSNDLTYAKACLESALTAIKQALAAQPAPKNRKDALRQLLLLEDGLTAKECEWVNEVNEGDKVKLRGGQSVAAVKSVYRQKGLAPDYYTLILAGGDTLELSGDELADLYEPAAQQEHEPENEPFVSLASVQEPVAWMFDCGNGGRMYAEDLDASVGWLPLYTTPPAQQAPVQPVKGCQHKRYSVDAREGTGTCHDCGAEGQMQFVVGDANPLKGK
jgi:hypothetical protein